VRSVRARLRPRALLLPRFFFFADTDDDDGDLFDAEEDR
jgi:hypothetical protein